MQVMGTVGGHLWVPMETGDGGYHAIKSRSTGTLAQMSQELCNVVSCHFKWKQFSFF